MLLDRRMYITFIISLNWDDITIINFIIFFLLLIIFVSDEVIHYFLCYSFVFAASNLQGTHRAVIHAPQSLL